VTGRADRMEAELLEEERQRLERAAAIETVDQAVVYLRALKLMTAGAYMSAPRGGEVESNIGSIFQSLSDVLAWLEARAKILHRQSAESFAALDSSPGESTVPPRLH